jgi:hypothetical protein
MDELILAFNATGVRYLLVGGQAMRLAGMPRFSMDWDFFIPPHDENNFTKLNEILKDELDVPLVALGARGESFIQTYQTRQGILQFHLGLPGVLRFDEAEKSAVSRQTEKGTPVKCLSGLQMLAAKRAADATPREDFLSEPSTTEAQRDAEVNHERARLIAEALKADRIAVNSMCTRWVTDVALPPAGQ